MSTNVVNIPGNYYLKVTNGNIRAEAGAFIKLTASDYYDLQANSYITNKAGSYIKNESGSYTENIIGGYQKNQISSYEQTEIGSYLDLKVIDYITQDVGSYIETKSGSYIETEASSFYSIKTSDEFRLDAGADIKVKGGSAVEFLNPGNFTIDNKAILFLTKDAGADIDVGGRFITGLKPRASSAYDLGEEGTTWKGLYVDTIDSYDAGNVQNPYLKVFDPNDVYGAEVGNIGQIALANAQRAAAPVYFRGGVGIAKDLNVGGFIYGRIETANTSLSISVTNTNVDVVFHPTFALNTGQQFLFIDNDGLEGGLTYNPFYGRLTTDKLVVGSTETSVSSTSGAAIIKGGTHIAKNLYVGDDIESGTILPHYDFESTSSVYTIGNTSTNWAEGYLNKIYTNIIRSNTGTIAVQPKEPLVDIFADIRVRGTNPIGTAPVVTNTLYVTMDGNDTNDGRAMDSSRACRTIGGALNSPYYKEGTQILVSAGFYLEDNPLRLKPYTSIRGSDIRTTFIEPINKTQDLFHVDSGCYLNYMTFLNGRSGLLEGPYEQGFNRGAYATAFPPLEGDERIDLFHSPYIQNCTNQSGPWLKDGTMFVPNQTVQIPSAVGTGTWEYNTTSIVVKVSTGTISRGMSINAGQQHPGFFNARTLLLANKPFIQEQVVTYVDKTFNSGSFTYDQVKCARDTGLIIDSIAIDLRQDSNSESIFAGLQYWRQSGYVDAIGGQITTTTAAINYLKTLAVNTVTFFAPGAGGVEGGIVSSRFDNILNILNTSTATLVNGSFAEWVTNSIVSNGTATSNAGVLSAYSTLLANKTYLTSATITFIQSTYPTFTFSTATCIRDIGYIIDSVAFDLKHGGNKQSIKSGVYYFGYTNTATEVPNEAPQVIQAYRYIKSIVSDVIRAKPLLTKYQTAVSQVTNLNSATNYEVEELQNRIDIITGIIRSGPSDYQAVGKRIPISLDANTTTGVTNAYSLLVANRAFIVAETIAYINSTTSFFSYNREKCRRDVGILVENLSYDAAFGGNQKAVESGLAYYDGVISKIAGQEVQTISAIDHLNEIAQKIIINTTVTDLLNGTGTYAQVINTALTGGSVASDSFENLKNIVTTIIDNGPDAAPVIYTSPGPDSAFVSAETLIEANRTFIQQDTINYINYTLLPAMYPGYFPYSEIKCRRDTGLIIDSVARDLLFPTPDKSQSTFAGLQYWGQNDYVGQIKVQLNPTVDAIIYLKDLVGKIIKNITPADDLIARYQSVTPQVTNLEPGTDAEVSVVQTNFNYIIEIVSGTKKGWTDRIVPNGDKSRLESVSNAFDLLLANKTYLGAEVNAYIQATNPGFAYDTVKCARDVGYMVEAVAYDMMYGGNRQSIQNGLYYFTFSGSVTNIRNETTQTIAAFNTLSYMIGLVVQNIAVDARQEKIKQVFSSTTATTVQANAIAANMTTITNIISSGPSVAAPPSAISTVSSAVTATIIAYDLIYKNKQFLIEETIAFIDDTYNNGFFNYDEAKCYRDVGLLLDAVSQDIILGGNSKSIEAGLAYWSSGYNSVGNQITTTTMAINHVRDMALAVAKNQAYPTQTSTVLTQVINPFFQYGNEYGPQEAIKRNFGIINKIIEFGPLYAPPKYAGGGLFSLVGINGADVKIAPQVVSVSTLTTGTYLIGLNTATIGFGINSTLYFGDTLIFPLRDSQVDELSYELTGNTSTWAQRKVDQVGSMGGSLVDGGVISDRSPIQSFVYDAYTQVNQGGRGVHIINDGYAQLVSVFTIFCSICVEVDRGGIASIVNSNANFGNICLQAKGYGKRKFSGHIYNPSYKAYPESPNIPGSEYLNQYYPNGFWPNGARVMVFLPDLDDRPHISLVMEIVPPDFVRDFTGEIVPQTNEQGFPGFLNASPTTSTLTTGSITISGISTDGVYIGNRVYARDQFGRTTSTNVDGSGNFIPYIQTGTVVTDVGYRTVTLSVPILAGGSDPTNTPNSINENYFDLYFCGNSYYTVLSSEVGDNPQYNKDNQLIPADSNILSVQALGLAVGQINEHIATLNHLNTITNRVITNLPVTSLQTGTSTSTQFTNLLVNDGGQASTFIDLRFDDMLNIIGAANLTAAENVVKPSLRKTSGPTVQGAGSAVTLITANLNFLADEVSAYVVQNFFTSNFISYSAAEKENIKVKCKRDTKIILQRLIYDIQTGGNYNMVMSGLSYWRREGTYHIVQLGENVTRTDLFPDGATVNFYQRSYMSASGYVFEYVGAGIDYGALPQRGVADPVQGKEVVQLNSGKVFFTSTDQNGDFRIGPELVISQATGVLSGRTFTKSLFANMTPFILAIEAGAL